ncbi:hypothetical protein Rhopal_004121-T1 [Rhodotorula paludigena]|uniref:Ribonuclease H2 subunit B n=1 Tax=Rhodotorula paludigena TaxID=86838 RepID=A0AAV5GKV1_9BASI|nr:hypothetical protein Rhopal_004121-T1 [Rhodotorula paludigena]
MERKHLCVLPEGVPLDSSDPSTSSARFLRLPHPRSRQPSLFLPYSSSISSPDGLLEVQKISLDADKSRSWFIEQETVSDGSLTLFSPFDPVFLAISYLSLLPPHFQAYSDLWESIGQLRFDGHGTNKATKKDAQPACESENQADFAEDVARLSRMECVRMRLAEVCETQEHESTTLYRLSQKSALDLLRAKVDALADAASGVFGPLEPTEPGEDIKREEDKPSSAQSDGQDPSNAGVPSRYETVSRGLAKEDAGSGHGLTAQLQTEARQKYAISIIANYLPPTLAKSLLASYTFPELTKYLSANTTSNVLQTTYLPGRGSAKLEANGESDQGFGAAAKKRKAEQSKGSRGVEALKKVNTKGMSSLKDLFGKQAAKKTAAPSADEKETGGPAKKKRKT